MLGEGLLEGQLEGQLEGLVKVHLDFGVRSSQTRLHKLEKLAVQKPVQKSWWQGG